MCIVYLFKFNNVWLLWNIGATTLCHSIAVLFMNGAKWLVINWCSWTNVFSCSHPYPLLCSFIGTPEPALTKRLRNTIGSSPNDRVRHHSASGTDAKKMQAALSAAKTNMHAENKDRSQSIASQPLLNGARDNAASDSEAANSTSTNDWKAIPPNSKDDAQPTSRSVDVGEVLSSVWTSWDVCETVIVSFLMRCCKWISLEYEVGSCFH